MDENQTTKQEEKLKKTNQANASNARVASAVADIASKSANPYARLAGKGVKVADKLTGGKTSERIGKALTRTNKMAEP